MLLLAAGGCPQAGAPSQGDRAAPQPAKLTAPRCVSVPPFSISQPDVVLLLTGSNHGRLEECNCPGPMTGGLSRRGGLVVSYRAAFGNVFLADTGNAFWIRPADRRNAYVLRAYHTLAYDAVALGDQEWAALPVGLAESLRAAQLRCLSTSAAAEATELPIVPAVVRDFGNLRLAAISYLGPQTLQFLDPGVRRRLVLRDLKAVQQLAGQLKADGCIVVLLAHVSEDELAGLANIQSVDLIVRGYTTHSEETLLRAGKIPVIKVGGPEYVAAAALKVDKARIVRIV